MASTNAVDAPKKATVHIQNTAPGPPKAIAVATPAMLPVPTRPDSDMVRAWNDDTPDGEVLPVKIERIISGIERTCMKRVRIEKYRPAPRHNAISALLQTRSLIAPMTSFIAFRLLFAAVLGR